MRLPEPSRLLSLFLAVAGGLLLWTAFPDAGVWPAAFVAVAVLYWSLGRDGAWWNFFVGFLFGLTFFLPHLWWAHESTEAAPWIAMSAVEALFLAGFGAGWTWVRRARFLRRRGWRLAAAFAVLFVAVEQWRAEVPFGGFPWGRLAWAMVDAPTGRAAWLGGTVAVSLLVAFAGVLLALAAASLVRAVRLRLPGSDGDTPSARGGVTSTGGPRHSTPGREARRAVGALALGAAVAVVPLVLPLATSASAGPVETPEGNEVYDAGSDLAEDGTLWAGAVQGNVGEPGLGAFANRAEVLNNHLEGTYTLAEDYAGELDVVLWPENGSDLDPQTTPDVARGLDEAAAAVGAPILVGAQEFPETGGRYNVSLLWQAGNGVIGRYAKQHPAPFGEYIPMRPFLRLLSDQVDRVTTDMIPGVNPPYVDVPSRLGQGDYRMGTIICFEVAYDEIIRDAVLRGAQVLVIPTNNASFGFTAESTQQLAMSRMQAMTTGRAAVQISTVGVSGVITPDGTVVRRTGLFTDDEFVANLPLRSSITPAVAAGYWPGWVVGGLAVALLVTGVGGGVGARRRMRAQTVPVVDGAVSLSR
ncbi:apolipoprotein N-acyltransferase [Promicromonospora iranensis]|uniref:Apolipoprotein N-acyltransferase n=1 Tax=Promicromonospora iranensis TaxID=1105144 RepID=A0ABU2CGX1_9MICO|nr:apolipoprotein N-acyltransferase [Promicromonospora iranensis]MDR7380581.1 apolipoprotein N-acyltransferase [Promicromonospora iranensis]